MNPKNMQKMADRPGSGDSLGIFSPRVLVQGFAKQETTIMKKHVLAAALICLTWLIWSFPFSTHAGTGTVLFARELSLEERITYQQRVENVYWQHQLWGKENQKPKPSLEKVMPDAAIRAKAEDAERQ